ncbi:hypothetical protein QLL95_gp1256 [Cotonvirus japonicus]|uniref:Uncharacterized protein n=1 Tax=Cotonvirus japonicus TaxID=2811091 RepID=A0ABM7NRZ6_9VIRU|nr:hypothetical protein QLL95_gp1256 [Cotonvirus japonicus]BCS82867.1 hypothetical protein [Cotonvirus japonicus]
MDVLKQIFDETSTRTKKEVILDKEQNEKQNEKQNKEQEPAIINGAADISIIDAIAMCPKTYRAQNNPPVRISNDNEMMREFAKKFDIFTKDIKEEISAIKNICVHENNVQKKIDTSEMNQIIPDNVLEVVEVTDATSMIKSGEKITVGLDVDTILEFDGPKILGGTRQKCVLYSPLDIELDEGFVATIGETKFTVVKNWITINTPVPAQQPSVIKTTLPVGTVILDGVGIPRKLEVPLEVDLPNPCPAILYAGTCLQQFKSQEDIPIDLQLKLANKHKVNITF